MPKVWVTASWANGMHDVYDLASLFQVSVTAMEVRLRTLGLLDDEPRREPRTYFRRSDPLVVLDWGMRYGIRGRRRR